MIVVFDSFAGLDSPEVGVGALGFGDEFIVGALLGDGPIGEDEDAVSVADGGEAVGDDELGAEFVPVAEEAEKRGVGLV